MRARAAAVEPTGEMRRAWLAANQLVEELRAVLKKAPAGNAVRVARMVADAARLARECAR
jgi:hypothetical protein